MLGIRNLGSKPLAAGRGASSSANLPVESDHLTSPRPLSGE